jgi:hypothetical protein
MKRFQSWIKSAGVGVLALGVLAGGALAGVPFNNLEGAGGIAFNPVAYPAGQNQEGKSDLPLSKPQFGFWYINLSDVDVDWTVLGVAETFFNRLEVSYGYETIAPNGENIHKSNVGGKLLLVSENLGDRKYIPAVSVGSVWKTTSEVADDVDDNSFDFYAVTTKLITELPRPVLLSAGVRSSEGRATGVFGYDSDRDITFFGNIDIMPVSFAAVGFEYKQGASYDEYEDADYWDAHLAYLANKNLTLAAAYVNAGNENSTARVGLGDGVVFSAQYAF